MRIIDDTFIIGIDSGYGNIKTANCCFPASVAAYDAEPVFKDNMLVYGNRFYLIGEGHKEFLADKTRDSDYYVLALAAIAREMNIKKLTTGRIRIAAVLPLTWVSGQRDDFKNYLLQNRSVEFSFRNTNYSIEIVGVDVFPQGFAAVADRLSDFKGVNMLCDIGNGTMNIMFINDKKPVPGNMFTEKFGTHQCLLAARENVMRVHHTTVDDAIINRVFRFGTADINEKYLKTITDRGATFGAEQRPAGCIQNTNLIRSDLLFRHPGGGDQYVPIREPKGKISTGGGGQPLCRDVMAGVYKLPDLFRIDGRIQLPAPRFSHSNLLRNRLREFIITASLH